MEIEDITDLNPEEIQNLEVKESIKACGFIARDKCGDLHFFNTTYDPIRDKFLGIKIGRWVSPVKCFVIRLDPNHFKNVTWESGPLMVTLTINPNDWTK